MSADQYDTKKPKFDDDGLKLVVTLDGRPVPDQALGIRAFKDACLANSHTPPPQAGTWTLTAPDGRTWQADSPLKACGLEQRERVPANVALARIVEEMDRFDAEEVAKQPRLETPADEIKRLQRELAGAKLSATTALEGLEQLMRIDPSAEIPARWKAALDGHCDGEELWTIFREVLAVWQTLTTQPPPDALPAYDGKLLELEEHIERMACWREAGDVLRYVRELRDQIIERREQRRAALTKDKGR